MLQDEWLELSSNKFGAFWLNKNTGETLFPQEMQGHQSPVSVSGGRAVWGEKVRTVHQCDSGCW